MAIFQIWGLGGAENAQNRTLGHQVATRLATRLLRFRRQTTPRSGSPHRGRQRRCVHAGRWACWSVAHAFLSMVAQEPLVLSSIQQKRHKHACRTLLRAVERGQPIAYSASVVRGGVHIISMRLWDQHSGCATRIRARAPRWRFSKSGGSGVPKTLKIAHWDTKWQRG